MNRIVAAPPVVRAVDHRPASTGSTVPLSTRRTRTGPIDTFDAAHELFLKIFLDGLPCRTVAHDTQQRDTMNACRR
jgi:hypothetical protein